MREAESYICPSIVTRSAVEGSGTWVTGVSHKIDLGYIEIRSINAGFVAVDASKLVFIWTT